MQENVENHKRISISGRKSISMRASGLRSSIVLVDALEKQRKSELFQEKKELFHWEHFKKNPRASFFDDPKCMEIITQQQLLEVFWFLSLNIIFIFKRNKKYK